MRRQLCAPAADRLAVVAAQAFDLAAAGKVQRLPEFDAVLLEDADEG